MVVVAAGRGWAGSGHSFIRLVVVEVDENGGLNGWKRWKRVESSVVVVVENLLWMSFVRNGGRSKLRDGRRWRRMRWL